MNLLKHVYTLTLLIWLTPCLADDLSASQIKSAYVLNFAKFVKWPAGTPWRANQATLCVLGSNALDGALKALDGRRAGGRTLRVVQLSDNEDASHGCNLIFIGKSEKNRLDEILKTTTQSPSLTISDIDDFAKKGGNIGLVYRNGRVVFEVNLLSTKKAGLDIPGQLLNLAINVIGL